MTTLSHPLAPAQEGLWFVHQLAPECSAYHLVFSLALHFAKPHPQPFDGLRMHLRALMDAYPVLRMRTGLGPDGPAQGVDPLAEPELRVEAVGDMPLDALRAKVRRDTRKPFDLTQSPLWRVHLYERGAGRWVMAVAAHHLAFDFWSLGLLLRDVAARCGLLPAGDPLDGEGHFLNSRAAARAGMSQASLAHWQRTLSGAPNTHGLPLDRPRPALPSHDGASLSFQMSRRTSLAVRHLAQAHQATPFMVLLAAYVVWLHRLSGDTDLVVVSPMAGRPKREHRHMLGQFVQTLPTRVTVTPELRFVDVLHAVRHQVIEGMRHPVTSFAHLVSEVAPRRDARLEPLSQLGFSWERLPLLDDFTAFFLPLYDGNPDTAPPAATLTTRAGAVTLHPFRVPQQEGQLDLLMEMGGEHQGAWVGVLKYRTAVFDEHTVAQWLASWTYLAEQLTLLPEQAVSTHALVPHTRAVMQGPGLSPPAQDVLAWWAQQLRNTPQAIAVEDAQHSWRHIDLLARAREVQRRLQAAGVQAGDHVGLMLDRHVDLPAAIWGIWLCRAAYVPLDPLFPVDRLRHMMTDAELRACVSEEAHRPLWPSKVPVISLSLSSADLPAPNPLDLTEPWPTLAGQDTAYLIYTSGSTGRPKGVRVAHGALLNFFTAMAGRLAPALTSNPCRCLAITTPAFDISVLELLWPVLIGGTVVVCDTPTTLDGHALAQRMQQARITMMQATPASWRLWLSGAAPISAPPALTALCGGEPLPQALAADLLSRCAGVWNLYGPTESTVWSSAAELRPGEPIHLGTPLAHTALHVLDAHQHPVPVGVMGELWIGGAGLAIDYWRRPALSAEKFQRLPHLPLAGRLYRTGDRVRVNAQGHLEHHGRLDFQVKLRGFRIELGEIEACLHQHPEVSEAVVVLRHPAGLSTLDPRLVAYVVRANSPDSPSAPTPDDEARWRGSLRAHLQTQLPSYMVPTQIVFLSALPQTPNRKLDRLALPEPDWAGHSAHREGVPPRDALELQLMSFFERHLGAQGLGVHDDFFELGGHSLLAMQVVNDVQSLLNTPLPVSEFMRHSTVDRLATRLRDHPPLQASMLVPLNAGAHRYVQTARHPDTHATGPSGPSPLWLFHPIGGSVFCYRALASHLNPEHPLIALQSPGLEAEDAAQVSVEAIARQALQTLQAHQAHGPYHLGGWCFGGVLAFEAARQLQAAGETIASLSLIDTRAPVAANLPSDGDDATLMSWFARDLAVPYGKVLHLPPESLRDLPAERMFDTVLQAARDLGVLAPSAQPELLRRYFEVYLANGIALQTYLPPAVTAPALLPLLLILAQDEAADYGHHLGWDTLMPPAQVVRMPGDHNSIVQAPHVAAVAQCIATAWTAQAAVPAVSIDSPGSP